MKRQSVNLVFKTVNQASNRLLNELELVLENRGFVLSNIRQELSKAANLRVVVFPKQPSTFERDSIVPPSKFFV